MTVAMLLTPECLPALLSDVTVSRDNLDLNTLSAPATIDFDDFKDSMGFVRKTRIISDSIAACVSGCLRSCADFIQFLTDNHSKYTDINVFFKVIEDTFSHSIDLEFIVCGIDDEKNVEVVSNGQVVDDFLVFGKGIFIGSGSEETIKRVKSCESHASIKMMDPINLIRGIHSSLIGSIILNEIIHGRKDYGGYFEACYYNSILSKWEFLQSNLNIFCLVRHIDEDSFTVDINSRMHCYFSPSNNFGSWLTIELNEGAISPSFYWLFRDILNISGPKSLPQLVHIWNQWDPRTFTFTFIIPSEDAAQMSIWSRSTDDDDDHRISASAAHGNFSVYWDPFLFEEICKGLESVVKKRYVSKAF